MTEKERTHAYTRLREITDEDTAEFLMSRLPADAISALATQANLDKVEAKVDRLAASMATKADLAKVDAKVDRLAAKVDKLDAKVDKMAASMVTKDELKAELEHYATKADLLAASRSQTKTIIIASISIATTLIAAMALTAAILGALLAA